MLVNKSVSALGRQETKQPDNRLSNLLSLINFDFFNKSVVSILRLDGVISKASITSGGLTLDGLDEQIQKAFKPKKLLAVCLIINSPGGLPVQAELIASRIRACAEQKSVPIYSFIEDVAASGGYWLACAGDEIYASKSSIIGSIGVISAGFGLHKAIEKLGIERRIYTQGSNKSILDAFMPEKEQDVEIVKNLQAQIHKHFIEYVKTRRKNRLTQTDAILFNGEFWAGQTAVDFGLIDGIDNCFNFIKNKFGHDIKIIHCKARESFIKKYFSSKTDIIGQVKQQLMYDRYDL